MVHQTTNPTIKTARSASKRIIAISTSPKRVSMHFTFKVVSLLTVIVVLESCSYKKDIDQLSKQEPPRQQSENIYREKKLENEHDYENIRGRVDLKNVLIWNSQDFKSAFLAWERNCLSPSIPLEYFIKCKESNYVNPSNFNQIKQFFETEFNAYLLSEKPGLLTAYYEPILLGSRKRTNVYKFPIYKRPKDLLTLKISEKLHSRKKLKNGKITNQYPTRKKLMEEQLLHGLELVFLADSVDNFFLHIQGSGTILLPDGEKIRVGYAGSNGHPYKSIGKWLADRGEMPLSSTSMQNIKKWVSDNPSQQEKLFNQNPRFIFFKENTRPIRNSEGPIGTLGIPLTANHSIAVDPKFVKLGTPLLVIKNNIENPGGYFMIAQDTGNAIKGPNRGDLFLGTGPEAGKIAGRTKFKGKFIVLVPK